MKTAFQYFNTILKTNKYLWYSIPLVAIVAYIFTFYLFEGTTINLAETTKASKGAESYKQAIWLADRGPFIQSIALVVLLPFLNFRFISKLFNNPLEFNLPVGPKQRFLAYILLASFVFIYNLILILAFNYGLQIYFQHQYAQLIQEGYDYFGYLYHSIPPKSIINNAIINPMLCLGGLAFFLILPLYFNGLLYFKKHSEIKSTFLLLGTGITIGYLSNLVWSQGSMMINNKTYLENYPIVIVVLTAIFLYIALYQLIKEREV